MNFYQTLTRTGTPGQVAQSTVLPFRQTVGPEYLQTPYWHDLPYERGFIIQGLSGNYEFVPGLRKIHVTPSGRRVWYMRDRWIEVGGKRFTE